jgi:plasmid stabilization system protein ParE
MVVFGDYLIFYRYGIGRVMIERVLHGARDIQNIF